MVPPGSAQSRVQPCNSPLIAPLRVIPDNAGLQLHPLAGFCITAVLPDAHLQGEKKGSAIGQGGSCLTASRPKRRRETPPSED